MPPKRKGDGLGTSAIGFRSSKAAPGILPPTVAAPPPIPHDE